MVTFIQQTTTNWAIFEGVIVIGAIHLIEWDETETHPYNVAYIDSNGESIADKFPTLDHAQNEVLNNT